MVRVNETFFYVAGFCVTEEQLYSRTSNPQTFDMKLCDWIFPQTPEQESGDKKPTATRLSCYWHW